MAVTHLAAEQRQFRNKALAQRRDVRKRKRPEHRAGQLRRADSRLGVRCRLLSRLPDQVGCPGLPGSLSRLPLTGEHLFDQLVKDRAAHRTAEDGSRGNLDRFRNFGAFDLGFSLADLIEFASARTVPGHGLAAGEYRDDSAAKISRVWPFSCGDTMPRIARLPWLRAKLPPCGPLSGVRQSQPVAIRSESRWRHDRNPNLRWWPNGRRYPIHPWSAGLFAAQSIHEHTGK